MHRIDSPGSVGGAFSMGNPHASPGIPATDASSAWLNSIQEELAGLIEGEGIALDKEDSTQLDAAILAMVGRLAGLTIGEQDTFPAPYAVLEGEGMLAGETFGVATEPGGIGEPVLVDLYGAHVIPKTTGAGTAFVKGGAVFWSDSARDARNSQAGLVFTIGYADAVAGDGDATVLVRLGGVTRGLGN